MFIKAARLLSRFIITSFGIRSVGWMGVAGGWGDGWATAGGGGAVEDGS